MPAAGDADAIACCRILGQRLFQVFIYRPGSHEFYGQAHPLPANARGWFVLHIRTYRTDWLLIGFHSDAYKNAAPVSMHARAHSVGQKRVGLIDHVEHPDRPPCKHFVSGRSVTCSLIIAPATSLIISANFIIACRFPHRNKFTCLRLLVRSSLFSRSRRRKHGFRNRPVGHGTGGACS